MMSLSPRAITHIFTFHLTPVLAKLKLLARYTCSISYSSLGQHKYTGIGVFDHNGGERTDLKLTFFDLQCSFLTVYEHVTFDDLNLTFVASRHPEK